MQADQGDHLWFSPAGIAVGISVLSLLVGSISLAWNIYRDVILKPRLRVQCGVFHLVGPDRKPTTHLVVSATNFGPGKTTVSMIQARNAPFWKRLTRKGQNFVVLHDWRNPESGQLPARLDVGEKVQLVLPYNPQCLLATGVTHVGVSDFFGRLHWAPRADVHRAVQDFAKDFHRNPAQPAAERQPR